MKYTVIFDANGGTGVMENQEFVFRQIQKLNSNQFAREGYIFDGWNTKSDGSGISYADEQQISLIINTTLYAQWKLEKYTVVFDANGGTGIMENQEFSYGVVQKLNSNSFEKEDYIFVGWNTKKDGSGISYTDGEEISVTSDTTLYAQWRSLKYTLTFDANGGTGVMESQEFVFRQSQKLNSNQFTRTGYEFNGWNTEKDGSGISYTDGEEISVTSDTALYAQWEIRKYTVTFESNGGVGTMSSQTFLYGVSQKLNSNRFSKEGYTFKGWNTKSDGTGTVYSGNQEITLTSNLTLYAQWKKDVTYVINGYKVDEVNKYIDLIDINTTNEDFLSNIVLGDGYTIEVETEEIEGKNLIYTGSKTKIYKNGSLYSEYTNVIRGDIAGDGMIDYLDYVYVYNHIYKVRHPDSDKKLLTNENLLAADADNDKVIDYLDYVVIYNKIKELRGGSN